MVVKHTGHCIMILIKCKHVNREVDGSIPDDIGPILDDRLKEKLKPWKGAHSSHFRVCPSVCLSVRGLQDTLSGLGT